MQFDDGYFGTPAHIGLARRTRDLWLLLRGDLRFGTCGRNIVVVGDQGADMAALMAAISRLTGNCGAHYYPMQRVDTLKAELADAGQTPDHWQHCTGRQQAYDLCKSIVAKEPLPGDLRLERLGPDSPAALVRATAELSFECGVTQMPGRNMRGIAAPGICLVALDGDGGAVATAGSYRYTHPDSAYRDWAFWGALATRPDRRGEKLAMILGAHAIVHMWEAHGVRGFSTGIKQDNAASLAVCSKQGVVPGDWAFVTRTDPGLFKSDAFTR